MIDIYFYKFKDLIHCLHDQYLPNLLKHYKLNDLREKFEPDLQPIQDLCQDMLMFQSRMEAVLSSNLKIRTQANDILKPRYFKDNIFLAENWIRYKMEQELKMKKMLQKLAA